MTIARRVLVVVGALVALMILFASLQTIYDRTNANANTVGTHECFVRSYLILEAQSVPTASKLPCVLNDMEGWEISSESYDNNGSRVVLTSADSGSVTWTLALDPSCTVPAGATPAPLVESSGEVLAVTTSSATTNASTGSNGSTPGSTAPHPIVSPDFSRHVSSSTADSFVTHSEWTQFPGGCLSQEIVVPERFDEQRIFDAIDESITLIDRGSLDSFVRQQSEGNFGLDPAPTTTAR